MFTDGLQRVVERVSQSGVPIPEMDGALGGLDRFSAVATDGPVKTVVRVMNEGEADMVIEGACIFEEAIAFLAVVPLFFINTFFHVFCFFTIHD